MQESKSLALGQGCYTLEIDGDSWTFSHLTFAQQAELEEWAKQQARAAIRSQRPQLTDDEYFGLLARKTNEFEAGDYQFMRTGWWRSVMCTREGNRRFYGGSLKAVHGKVSDKELDAICDYLSSNGEEATQVTTAIITFPPSLSPAGRPGLKETLESAVTENGSAIPTR